MAFTQKIPLGCHVSTAGGLYNAVERAEETGCRAFQIFARNPRSWQVRPIPDGGLERFRSLREKSGLWPLVVHTAYLINLSSPDELIFDKSLELFKVELSLAEQLKAEYLVTHLGSPKGKGRGFAVAQVTRALQEVKESGINKDTAILFENSAHKGMTGTDIDEIGEVIRIALALGLKAGMCFDTCHGFAAGYPMGNRAEAEALARAIREAVGPGGLRLIHLNDSKGDAGSGVDRHANIGEGRLGDKSLRAFLRADGIRGLPVILETPVKEEGDDIKNLSAARSLIGRPLKAGA
ncbi:MAG: deoxyribonuclease IV [Thermodesulfobacteriota bacterium]